MSLNKYACYIAHICPTALIQYSKCRPHITAYISQETVNYNFWLPSYYLICANNKYAPQMPYIFHMLNYLICSNGGSMPNMPYMYSMTNHVARSTVHRWWWWHWCSWCSTTVIQGNDDNDAKASLHILIWPLGLINKKNSNTSLSRPMQTLLSIHRCLQMLLGCYTLSTQIKLLKV